MHEFVENFHFLRPWWLLALILPTVFYIKYFRGIRSKSSWENVCDKKLLNFLLIKGSSAQRRILGFLGLSAFICGIFAIAGPTWQKQEAPSMAPENPVIILLNLSSDMKETDITPNRLERAKYKIIDLLNGLKSAQSGLIVYTDEPYLITPLTDDKDIIINLLPVINDKIMPSNGDRLDRAIDLAVEKFKTAGYFNGNIVIFSPDVGQRFDLALEAAKRATEDKFNVSVLAVCKDNNEKLKLISRYGNGIYENLTGSDRDILKIDTFINENISELKISDNLSSTWKDFGYYLVFIPFICCLYFFRRGIFVLIFLLSSTPLAHANMFLNDDQQAYLSFQKGDFKAAAEKFNDTNWKASSLYRMGDFQAALKNFEKTNDVTALYNQGNALAKSGKIAEAIKKYEEVLKSEPEHEDAKFNLEYLKRQQQQQQQNQQQSSQNQQNQQAQDNQQQTQNNQGDNQENQNSPQDSEQDKQEQNNKEQDRQDAQSGENDQPAQENQQDQGQKQSQQGNEQNQDKPQKDEPQGSSSAPQNDGSEEREAAAAGNDEQGSGDEEERQARIQKFRDIPEDPGGLLRAFIAKEYRLNRYGDD